MSEFNFSNVKAREVNPATTSSYMISELEGCPSLTGVFAGEKNKGLRKAVTTANAKVGKGRRKLSDEAIVKVGRANVRAFFPLHVFTRWEDVVDGDGEQVEFSPDACGAFLKALPDWLLQGVIEHFGDPANFAGESITQEDVGETAKN